MDAAEHIEALITTGFMLAHMRKFPKRYDSWAHDVGAAPSVGFNCEYLDKLKVPWSQQNVALQFINAGNDAEVWDCFYRNQFKDLAKRILAGTPWPDILRKD